MKTLLDLWTWSRLDFIACKAEHSLCPQGEGKSAVFGINLFVFLSRPEMKTASRKWTSLLLSLENKVMLLFPSMISYDWEGDTEVEGEEREADWKLVKFLISCDTWTLEGVLWEEEKILEKKPPGFFVLFGDWFDSLSFSFCF